MHAIEIMESILSSTTLVVNICDNINTLRRASIHPEVVKARYKQADFISCLSDIYKSINSGMLLVHVYGHQDIDNLASTLTPIAPLSVQLESLAEHIMA